MELKEKIKNWLFPVLTEEQKEAKRRIKQVFNMVPIVIISIPFVLLYSAIKDIVEG